MTETTNERNRIFISNRRDEARGASGRLYDWLRIAFGRKQVFRDVASLGASKWRQKIDEALAASAVRLPIIGFGGAMTPMGLVWRMRATWCATNS